MGFGGGGGSGTGVSAHIHSTSVGEGGALKLDGSTSSGTAINISSADYPIEVLM
jgi:hypothetical protein